MKKTTKILSLLLVLFGSAWVTGCTPQTDTPEVPEDNSKEVVTYTVTIASDIVNGSVCANKATAAEGETVTLTVTPNNGYEPDGLPSVKMGDTEILVSDEYTFTMPAGNVTVNVAFKEIVREYTIKFYSRNTGKEFTDTKKDVLQNALNNDPNYNNGNYTIHGIIPEGDILKEHFRLINYLARYGNEGYSAYSTLPTQGYDILVQLSLVEIDENNLIIKIYYDTIVTPTTMVKK